MTGDDTPARQSAASLEQVYGRLFATDGSSVEHPEYERKDFFLSAEMIALHGKKLVETIAAIANTGRSDGLIMCRGRIGETGAPPLEDPQRLDLLVGSAVYPSVRVTITRMTISGDLVDVIVIPRSSQRPHVMRMGEGDNRFFVPLRGSANNVTAARHQIDEMYQELTLATLRRAFPAIRFDTDDRDAALGYAADIGYGLDAE